MKSRKWFAGCLLVISTWLLGACAVSTDSEDTDPQVSTEEDVGTAEEGLGGCGLRKSMPYCAPANCWCCTTDLSSCTQYPGNCHDIGC
jgi:hypothetical protein